MNKRDAKKLHNGDEVFIKETQEVATVLNTPIEFGGLLSFNATSPSRGFTTLYHDEVS
jgi:hypothetical protein